MVRTVQWGKLQVPNSIVQQEISRIQIQVQRVSTPNGLTLDSYQ